MSNMCIEYKCPFVLPGSQEAILYTAFLVVLQKFSSPWRVSMPNWAALCKTVRSCVKNMRKPGEMSKRKEGWRILQLYTHIVTVCVQSLLLNRQQLLMTNVNNNDDESQRLRDCLVFI